MFPRYFTCDVLRILVHYDCYCYYDYDYDY